jgi:hypothetical protein
MPLDGTPLAAWNAITPEQAEVFKSRGVRTVEEIAGLTDAHIERIPVMRLRDLVRQAQLFIASADTTRFAHTLARAEQENAALKATVEEQKSQIVDLLAKVNQLAERVGQGAGDDSRAAAAASAASAGQKSARSKPAARKAA